MISNNILIFTFKMYPFKSLTLTIFLIHKKTLIRTKQIRAMRATERTKLSSCPLVCSSFYINFFSSDKRLFTEIERVYQAEIFKYGY